MRKVLHPIAVSLLLCLVSVAIATPRTSEYRRPVSQAITNDIDFSELDKLVPVELKERNTPGAVIAIVMGDRVVYQKAFGLANVETNTAMQSEMLFRLGSTTKMFTAAAMVALADQNKIKLNESIGNRVKGLNPRIGQLTPNDLLSNSAGIRDFGATVISNDEG